MEKILEVIQSLALNKSDRRLNVINVEIQSLEAGKLILSGRVLDQNDLVQIIEALLRKFKDLDVDTSKVEVLRKSTNQILTVGTNLTSLHNATSFQSEMSSQMVFGNTVEILLEQENWVFGRQLDGYLGWTYKPYLTDSESAGATHIVLSPALSLYKSPDANSPVLTRVFCGSQVTLKAVNGNWAQISANVTGWTELSNLRALADIPTQPDMQRNQILIDAPRMIGVPYLWGGISGNGIDCSGFSRLVHRWAGVDIPRDADMQSAQCKEVVAPFKPGDLCFFGEASTARRITHVGISLGGWNIIHSSRSRNGVYLDNIQENPFLQSIFVHAGTFLE